jgi:hypothetical protein
VRDASVEALASLAAAAAEAAGGPLPGSAAANPFLRVVTECLAEQKKEAQLAAGSALQQVGPTGLWGWVQTRRQQLETVLVSAYPFMGAHGSAWA